LLERVRKTVLGAYAFHELPFERLVEALRPHRDLSRHPLFQTVFVLQQTEAMAPNFDLPGLTSEVIPVSGDVPVRFDLELHLTLSPERVGGYVFFNHSLFRETTVERLLEQYRILMGNLIAAPGRPVSSAPLESEESMKALEAWSHA
jgi:non-ribosomal peptide synthetase component F